MADIIQAAKWMNEGKAVVRAHWKSELNSFRYIEKRNKYGGIQDDLECCHSLHLNDILAGDWEIVE